MRSSLFFSVRKTSSSFFFFGTHRPLFFFSSLSARERRGGGIGGGGVYHSSYPKMMARTSPSIAAVAAASLSRRTPRMIPIATTTPTKTMMTAMVQPMLHLARAPRLGVIARPPPPAPAAVVAAASASFRSPLRSSDLNRLGETSLSPSKQSSAG